MLYFAIMAGVNLTQAQEKLDEALAALSRAMEAEAYSIQTGAGARSVNRSGVDALQRQVVFWDRMVKRLSSGGMRITRMVSR